MSSVRSPGSSSSGVFWLETDGGKRIHSRCRRLRVGTACVSRSRISATTPTTSNAFARARESSPKGRTASSLRTCTRRKVLLIAGGIGITPLRALLASMPASPGDLTLLYRAVSADDLIFRDELTQLGERRGIVLHALLGDVIGDDRTDQLGVPAIIQLVPDVYRATSSCAGRRASWTRCAVGCEQSVYRPPRFTSSGLSSEEDRSVRRVVMVIVCTIGGLALLLSLIRARASAPGRSRGVPRCIRRPAGLRRRRGVDRHRAAFDHESGDAG